MICLETVVKMVGPENWLAWSPAKRWLLEEGRQDGQLLKTFWILDGPQRDQFSKIIDDVIWLIGTEVFQKTGSQKKENVGNVEIINNRHQKNGPDIGKPTGIEQHKESNIEKHNRIRKRKTRTLEMISNRHEKNEPNIGK